MKKAFAAVFALLLIASALAFAADANTYVGWVTDAKCGVKGAHAGAEACAKKCLEAGEEPVLVTDSDKTVLKVHNGDKLRPFAGKHVSVTGSVQENMLHVDSVTEAEVAK